MNQVFQISALRDNYIHVIRTNTGKTAVVDPSEEEPVCRFLKEKNWSLHYILNTHHHWDHTGGNVGLKKKWPQAQVIGFAGDAHRIPQIDILVQENEMWKGEGLEFQVLFIPGHTLGHIAFWFQKEGWLFCGDTLFAMGCGRLFEGTAQQMLSSLNKLKSLPLKTQIYCGHEYTLHNGHFALEVDSENLALKKRVKQTEELRKKGISTVPFLLEEERDTNPFLRCSIFLKKPPPPLQSWMQAQKNLNELRLFSRIREFKDHY